MHAGMVLIRGSLKPSFMLATIFNVLFSPFSFSNAPNIFHELASGYPAARFSFGITKTESLPPHYHPNLHTGTTCTLHPLIEAIHCEWYFPWCPTINQYHNKQEDEP